MMKPARPHPLLVALAMLFIAIIVAVMAGCPQGTKTTVEAGVTAQVDPVHCAEIKGDAGELPGTQNVALDCVNLTGTGTIRVEFPRKSWWDIKLLADGGASAAGPGK